MNNKFGCALVVPMALILASCGGTPGCSDAKTTELVIRGFTQKLDELLREDKTSQQLIDQFRPTLQVALTTITVTATDEKIKKNSCAGTLEVKLTNDALKILGDEQLSRVTLGKAPSDLLFKIKDGAAQMDVKYTAQPTEDTKKLLVEMKGHAPLADAIARLAGYGAMDPAGKSLSLPPMAHACNSASGLDQLRDLFRDGLAARGKTHGLSPDFIGDVQKSMALSLKNVRAVKSAPDLSSFDCIGDLQLPVSEVELTALKKMNSDPNAVLLVLMAAATSGRYSGQEIKLLGVIPKSGGLVGDKAIADDFTYRSFLSENKKDVYMQAQGHYPALDLYLAAKLISRTTPIPQADKQ